MRFGAEIIGVRVQRTVACVGGVLVATMLISACGGQQQSIPQPQASPSPSATPTPIDLSRFYFPISIDYANPSQYLRSGTQSTLTTDSANMVNDQVQVPNRDLAGLGRIFDWIGRSFTSDPAGGRTIGKTDVNDLLRDRVQRGCHDVGLLFSTLARHFGYPAVMVDTAGIDWAEKHRTGQVQSHTGHVFAEVYVNERWIIVNPTAGFYAANYDFQQPVVPFIGSGDGRGFYVLYKGVDPAGYGVTSSDVLAARMDEFSQAFPQIPLVFPNYDFRHLPNQ